ncbi:hypothetical protein [Streptomyces acidiscabies]|uniref:Uncharacterized protein n=1 Tax=Streptomyces acidiscabies TaxID=42234 RepID=A0ABU4LW54_9ACTN|nr:hypothetical protein [Streptomyces acidiscabies]MDX3019991.1 hypothetical protein [Streptomyces acidiscabies]
MTVIAAPIADLLLADAASAEMPRAVTTSELLGVAAQLPELEWCPFCSYDETSEPGLPRDIVKHVIEPALPPEDWDPGWGQGPLYEVTYLSCGHTLAKLCEAAVPTFHSPQGTSPCPP